MLEIIIHNMVNEVTVVDTTCPMYSTPARSSLVFLGLTATLNLRSRSNSLRAFARIISEFLPWISTSSIYSLQMRYTKPARTVLDLLR